MEKILLVEDSKVFQRAICERIEACCPFKVDTAASFAEARELVENASLPYFVALLDLTLPDSAKGEVVAYALENNIPSIVFTGTFDNAVREDLMQKGVLDYIAKESPASIDLLAETVQRLYRNVTTKVLVVDDSRVGRMYISRLLERHNLQVFQAEHGKQALEVLAANKDIRLVLTDYNMPEMDGFELVREIRREFKRDQVAIIGISAQGDGTLSPRFLKGGANDFVTKPFQDEEFNCRVAQNLDNIENINALREAAIRDTLTGLHNRRYLFDVGEKLYASFMRDQITLSAVMIDIDHFKKVNDTYGHDGGDAVLKMFSKLLVDEFRDTDVVSRMGGEEFCILMANSDPDSTAQVLERVRSEIEHAQADNDGTIIKVTASFGCCLADNDGLENLIKRADEALYEAKETGRNKVVMV